MEIVGNGHIVEAWSFAGVTSGGIRINADSLEEVDAIMAENPLGGTRDVQVFPSVDLQEALQRGIQITKAHLEAMAQMAGG